MSDPQPTALEVVHRQQQAVTISEAELVTLRDTLNPDLSPAELRLFGLVAKRSGLDPFAKQVYAVKRKGRVTFQTGIDGYRSIAERTGQYDGQDEPTYSGACPCGAAPKGHPESCTVRVYRKDMGRPIAATAYWHEYVVLEGTPPAVGFMWGKMPRVMIAKCAEALALRKAFPYVYNDLYTDDEMGQADNQPNTPVANGRAQGDPPSPSAASSQIGEAPAAEAPGSEPAAGADYYEGQLIEAPDRVRDVKRPDWLGNMPENQRVAKLELKLKIGQGKNTGVLIGAMAHDAFAADLEADETVRVEGERREVVWQQGKPTRKEIIRVRHVWVLRNGDYRLIAGGGPEQPAPKADEAEPVEGEFTPVDEAAAKADELLALAPYQGEGDIDAELTLLRARWQQTASGRPFLLLELYDHADNFLIRAAMDQTEANETLTSSEAKPEGRLEVGQMVRLVGAWVPQGVVIVTGVTEA